MINAKIYELLPDNKCVAVDENKKSYTATIKGSIKKNKLYVGDNICLEEKAGTFVVSSVLERKNFFIRPPVSNIDYMIISISLDSPKPDFMLLDKQIILCKAKGIIPIILITKMDLLDENTKSDYDYINRVYSSMDIQVYSISSEQNEVLTEIVQLEEGKVYSFSGNSGVGKSTIISKLTKDFSIETSTVSRKTNKGRHTTKYVKLYEVNKAYILDTPGFSSYDLIGVELKDLKEYYDDFSKVKCIYSDCKHIFENECKVKEEVLKGNIDKSRYDRYVKLYSDLKIKDDMKYKR